MIKASDYECGAYDFIQGVPTFQNLLCLMRVNTDVFRVSFSPPHN